MSPVFSWEKLKRYHLQWVIPLVIAVILISVYVVPIFYHSSNTIQNNKIPFQSENMVKLSGNVPYIISNATCSQNLSNLQKAPGGLTLPLTLYLNYTNISMLEKCAF